MLGCEGCGALASLRGIASVFAFERAVTSIAETAFTIFEAFIRLIGHGTTSRLAWKAAFNAEFRRGTSTSFIARIFSITHSIK